MVTEVSAIEVASTTLPATLGGAHGAILHPGIERPNSGTIRCWRRGTRSLRKFCVRRIRQHRQKRQHRAWIGAQRHRDGVRICRSSVRVGLAAEIARLDRKARPSLATTFASPSSFVDPRASNVADITGCGNLRGKPVCASARQCEPNRHRWRS